MIRAASTLLLLCMCPIALAQERLVGPALEIHCTAAARDAGIAVLNVFGEVRARVHAALGLDSTVPVVVELVPDSAALRARVRAAGAAEPEDWVAAVALPHMGLMILRTDSAGGALQRLRGLLAHEMAHLALGAALRASGTAPLPRWVDEGLAQIAEGRLLLDETPALHMRAFFHTLLPLSALDGRFPETEGGGALAYAQSESFMKWLGRRGPLGVHALVQMLVHGAPLNNAVRAHTGLDLVQAEAAWVRELREDRSWMLETLLQIGFGAFVAVACVLAISRYVRRRRKLLQVLEIAEAAEVSEDANDSVAREGPLRIRRVRHFGWRPLRKDEEDPPV